ncbi:unnamed protein product [Choristocarpus tenellus]
MVGEFARGERDNSLVKVGKEVELTGVEEITLPAVLNARQRLLVHEAAERQGIGHISRGEGDQRRIVLTRKCGMMRDDEGCTHCHPPSIRSCKVQPSAKCFDESDVLGGDDGMAEVTGLDAKGPKEEEIQCNDGVVQPENRLLASLHAERRARSQETSTKSMTALGQMVDAQGGAGGLGFEVQTGANLKGLGGVACKGGQGKGSKGASKKKGKGKKANAGSGKGLGGEQGWSRGMTHTVERKVPATGASTGGGAKGEEDDDMSFLDAEIKKVRKSEPCYSDLLRLTNSAMRERNPGWAAEQDRPRPSKSVLSGKEREKLKGVLQTRLTEEEKRRSSKAVKKGGHI